MSATWSERVAAKYAVKLPADLSAWLDDEQWKRPGGAEFNEPLTPAALLELSSEQLWAGFMLPDTLPLIGNQYGDWLCLRADAAGEISEVIYWSHAGGDWTPYGRTLAEALFYDAAFRVLYSRKPEFAAEPEPPPTEVFRSAQWSLGWTNGAKRTVGEFWTRGSMSHDELLDGFVRSGVAQVAARRDLILMHLNSELRSHADPKLASEVGAPWEPDFVSWLFDTALIPDRHRADFSDRFQTPATRLTRQNWQAAEREALVVCKTRKDLGWSFDISGWAAERRGEFGPAIQRYLHGLRTSLFADDTVRFRTHWFAEGYGKFAAARLAELRTHMTAEQLSDPYLALFWENDASSLRERVRSFWLERAHAAEADRRYLDAYWCYYNAGWDLGSQSISFYDEIFDGLVHAAKAAGAEALARIATVHRNCL